MSRAGNNRRRTRGLTTQQRFWFYVQKTETCWLWTGYLNRDGYGRLWNGSTRVPAHRYAYELLVGPIAPGLPLDHLCRVPACVNPAHLEPVTHRVNILRGMGPPATNAVKEVCVAGHRLTPDNTYLNPRGQRECRTCRREVWRRHRAKKRRCA